MTSGPDIQFDSDHRPVLTTGPDIYFDEPPADPEDPTPSLNTSQILDLIVASARDPEEIAARALVVAMLFKHPAAPTSIVQFATMMNYSRSTGHRKWDAICQCLQALRRNSWEKETIGDGSTI